MKFLFLFIFSTSCASYTTSHGIKIYDDDVKINQQYIETSINILLVALNREGADLSNIDIRIIKFPLCFKKNDKIIIADGYTIPSSIPLMRDSIFVSTYRGCFDSLVHEIAHMLYLEDINHLDKKYWDTVSGVERWVKGELCEDYIFNISINVCI